MYIYIYNPNLLKIFALKENIIRFKNIREIIWKFAANAKNHWIKLSLKIFGSLVCGGPQLRMKVHKNKNFENH